MNRNLLGRLRGRGLLLAACLGLVATGNLSAGTTAGRAESQIDQFTIPIYGDSTPWGKYYRQLQDTMATRWYEELKYYDHLYVYSHGFVTARFVVTPDGTFHNPQILSNTSNPPMANAVIRAIHKAWIGRFPPAVVAMAPSGLVVEQTFRFWDYDPVNYGLASSYPQLLTRRSPEIGGAYNLDLRKFFDLSRFRFQSRILQAAPASGALASR
jgi:hypothetical protein